MIVGRLLFALNVLMIGVVFVYETDAAVDVINLPVVILSASASTVTPPNHASYKQTITETFVLARAKLSTSFRPRLGLSPVSVHYRQLFFGQSLRLGSLDAINKAFSGRASGLERPFGGAERPRWGCPGARLGASLNLSQSTRSTRVH